MDRCGYEIPLKNVRRAIGYTRVSNIFNPGLRKKDIRHLSTYLTVEWKLYKNSVEEVIWKM